MSEEMFEQVAENEAIDMTEEEIRPEPVEEVTEEVVETDNSEEGVAEESDEKEAEAPKDEGSVEDQEQEVVEQQSPRARRRLRTRRSSGNDMSELDYMGSAFTLSSTENNVRNELRAIEDIIAHNARVSETGRGEYQYMLAMMTGNDESRENNDPNRLTATNVYAIEVFPHENEPDTYGNITLVFTGEDFTYYSGLVSNGTENSSELIRRQRSYTNHAPLSKFQCVPVQVYHTDKGQVRVACSRAFAMEQMQQRFFFGNHPLAQVGGVAYAYVMAADDNGVRVECMGIETRINRGQLTARRLVLHAGDVYKPGMKIPVIIRELEFSEPTENEDPKVTKIVLSGVDYEVKQGLVRSVTEFDLDKKPHEVAQVVSITPNYYIVRLTMYGIIGLIAKDNVRNSVDLKRGDNVFMEIVRVNERYNRVMGNCIKI